MLTLALTGQTAYVRVRNLLLFYLTTLEKSSFLLSAAKYLAERVGLEPTRQAS